MVESPLVSEAPGTEATIGEGRRGFPIRDNPCATIATWTLAAAAAIHVMAAWSHRDQGGTHVAFFVGAAALQAGLAVRAATRWTVADRGAAGVVALAVSGVWLLSRSAGLPFGIGKEEVGLGDALAAVLQMVTATMALLGASASALPTPRRGALLASSLAGLGALAVALPAVAGQGHNTAEVSSISAVWAAHGGHSQNEGATTLTGNGLVQESRKACNPSLARVRAADDLVARTAIGMEKYRDVQTAIDDGFRPLGFEPNGVYHYISERYRKDPSVLDPSKPESIVYGRLPDGGLRPIGVMYMMPSKAGEPPRPGGCLMTWHAHGFPFAAIGEETVPMVHVWIIPVPGGPFAHESGPDYARIYLRKTPVPAEDINAVLNSVKDITQGKAITAEQITAAITLRRLGNGPQRCGAEGRGAYTAFGVSKVLQDQLCDPLLSAPVPGRPTDRVFGGLFGGDQRSADGRNRLGTVFGG